MGFAWQTFVRLEERLEQSLYYVPLEYPNEHIWSPFYREILIQVGSEVDSFFRNMIHSKSLNTFASVKQVRQKKGNLDIRDYRKAFEPIFELSSVKIDVSSPNLHYDEIKPFAYFGNIKGTKTPQWWSDHQKVKHDWAENYQKAHLRNVIEALSGLFALNVLHKECQNYLINMGVINSPASDFPLRHDYPANIKAIITKSFVGIPEDYEIGMDAKSKLFFHRFRRDKNVRLGGL